MEGRIRTVDIRQPFSVVVDKKTGKAKSIRSVLNKKTHAKKAKV